MAITSANLDWYISGAASDGAAQTDPDASFGNFRSATTCGTGSHNVFDGVSGAEAAAGDIEYRCICVKNNHASLSLQSTKVWINTTTGVTDDNMAFAVEVPQGGDTTGSAQTIGGEGTSPDTSSTYWSGSSATEWSTATSKAAGVAIDFGGHDANLDHAEHLFIWSRRTVAAGAAAQSGETMHFAIGGATAA